jgi:8-oxo-dGTP pyrophosphatase MutT (NUDIX family)
VSTSQSTSASAPRPAATVVVLRDADRAPEVFMVRRHEGTAFMGGAHVFPGGRVDPADRDIAAPRWCDGVAEAAARFPELPPADAVAYHVAAARELFEEAGVLLARDEAGEFISLVGAAERKRLAQDRRDVHGGGLTLADIVEREGLRLALEALVPFAHWVTPPIDVRAFDTRFFVARVPPRQNAVHDDTETTASVWITAADAIAGCRRGEIVLPPPTWTTLREIESYRSVDDVMAWARARTIARRQPMFLEQGGAKMLLLPGDPLNPEPAAEPPPAETRFVLVDGRWRAEAART